MNNKRYNFNVNNYHMNRSGATIQSDNLDELKQVKAQLEGMGNQCFSIWDCKENKNVD